MKLTRLGRMAAGALLVLAAGCTTTRTIYIHTTVTASPAASARATVGNVSPDSGYPSAPDTYSPSAQPTTQTLNSSCTVDSGQDTAGWTMTFTNNSATDITVELYSVVFFSASGAETGSLQADADNLPLTVAAGNSVSDVEHHDFSGDPDPAGSVTCRLSSWSAA